MTEAILRDGTSVVIRSMVPSDRDQFAALVRRMSPLSLHHRFCGAKRELTDDELRYLTSPDGRQHVAVAAFSRDKMVGIGRYVRVGVDAAEIAFDVADVDQGRGIGTLLLEHLASIARAAGVTRFQALVEADNERMLDVFEHSGFATRQVLDTGIREIEFAIDDTDRFLAASAERERLAAARSLRVFFAPRAVAVVGASRTSRTIGRAVVDNLIRDGYRGQIYPVNPHAAEIAGRPCYPSIASIGQPVDLAVIAVPARDVAGVAKECAAAGVGGVVVLSSGFAEIGAIAAERELCEIVRQAGMRMVGPNCLGVLSTDPQLPLDATFSPVFPPAGNISLASQSGALGLAMLDLSRDLRLGIASFVSLGDKADVSVNDLLAYWSDDRRTRVIALCLESFGNPRSFVRLAQRISRDKPIIAVKSGRSAVASLDIGLDALFAQTGVIRTDTLEQMFDLASLLSSQPVPAGRRVGVVTNAGGPGLLLADACEARGLVLPALAADTTRALRSLLPPAAAVGNPVDMTAAAPPDHFERAVALVGRDPNIDTVAAIYVPPLVAQPDEIAAAIARGAGAVPATKPIVTVFMSSTGTPALLARGPRGPIPSYSFPENVAIALSAAARYGEWRVRPSSHHFAFAREQEQAIRTFVASCDDGWLSMSSIAALLAIAGVRVAEFRIVEASPNAACTASLELGFPCVLKAIAPGLVHVSDAGGVALHLDGEQEVARAARTMLAKVPSARQLMIQRQVPRGVEAMVGVTTDPTLGPLVASGIGGIAIELYKDVALRVVPLTYLDATEMLDQLRGKSLLEGFRGAPVADRAALIDVIQRVAALVEIVPELVELELDPVIVMESGLGATAVDARLRLCRGTPTAR